MSRLYAYHVSYDLKSKPPADYKALHTALKATPSKRPLESTWIVETDETAIALYARLSRHMHRNDKLFISQVNGNHAGWLPSMVWTWLNAIPTAARKAARTASR